MHFRGGPLHRNLYVVLHPRTEDRWLEMDLLCCSEFCQICIAIAKLATNRGVRFHRSYSYVTTSPNRPSILNRTGSTMAHHVCTHVTSYTRLLSLCLSLVNLFSTLFSLVSRTNGKKASKHYIYMYDSPRVSPSSPHEVRSCSTNKRV